MNRNQTQLNELKKIVGQSRYLKLLTFFGGESIYFPVNNEEGKRQRNEAIRQDRKDGVTISRLIQKYGLSESQIRRIIKEG